MKIFLSSTGRDLKEERDAAFRVICRLGCQCVRMEDFIGPGIPIAQFDHERVADCDLFIIIIGFLHGNPENGEQSYTELEYEAAVRLDKPRFLFLAPKGTPLPEDLIESDLKRESQRKFRERVSGLIRQNFRSPDDLASQIAAAIRNYEQGQHLKQSRPADSLMPVPPEPYFAHPYPLQKNFTGRERERMMLTKWLAGDTNTLSLAAIGGMGKSALTWWWLENDVLEAMQEKDRPEGVMWWSFYDSQASFAEFLREALRYASNGEADAKFYPSQFDQIRILANFLRRKRLLLVLDGFERELRAYTGLNAAYQGDEIKFGGESRECISPHASRFLEQIGSVRMATRVLLTTRLHPFELDGIEGCQHEDLSSLALDDVFSFFRAEGIKGTRAEVRAACEPYGYHPLAIRLLAGVIVNDYRTPGDISVAAQHAVVADLKGKANHHILQVAYDAMVEPRRELLSSLAAFRNPVGYEAIAAISPTVPDAGMKELIDRGLLMFDRTQARYDMHPVVRQYAYDRLTDKKGTHTRLRDYFASVPTVSREGAGLDELTPVIELYHHTLGGRLYDQARQLFRDRLAHQLYYRLGAYQTCIDLLTGLFPLGEESPPELTKWQDRAWTQNALALSYSRAGRTARSLRLFVASSQAYAKGDDSENRAILLVNIANERFKLGSLREAEANLLRAANLSGKTGDPLNEGLARMHLIHLQARRGRFKEARKTADGAIKMFRHANLKSSEGICWAFLALLLLLKKSPSEAIEAAMTARRLADSEGNERDIIRAEWLLGWAGTESTLSDAESHLNEALTRCRRISGVDLEPDILLAWCRWHRSRKSFPQANKDAQEALAIADRCGYRLVQADTHNLLAHLAMDAGKGAEAHAHAQQAKDRATCDGSPYSYQPALDEAKRLLLSAGS